MASLKVKYIALETPDLAGRLRQPLTVSIGVFTTCKIVDLCFVTGYCIVVKHSNIMHIGLMKLFHRIT